MKRILLTCIISCIVMGLSAQNIQTGEYTPIQKAGAPLKYQFPQDRLMSPAATPKQHTGSHRTPVTGQVLGTTTYDLQTNSATPARLVLGPNGKMTATWTGASTLSGGWPDRGTYYAYFDGTNWTTPPTQRIENIRTGWPANVILPDGSGGYKEFIISHDPAAYNLVFMDRSTLGSGSWTTTSMSNFSGIWPRAVSGGPDGRTIHLIHANACSGGGCNNYTLYSRSLDGGTTWDIVDKKLPGMDTANCYNALAGDAYAIAARGNTVAIVTGNSNNTLRIWKSTDNGTTWTSSVVMTLPLCGFDGSTITDTVPQDGVPDTLFTNDGAYDILIDNNGMVHVWFGLTRIYDNDPTAGSGWFFFPGVNNLLYWNESFGADNLMSVGYCPDIDGDGTLAGIGADLPNYGVGLASQPAAAIDTSTGAFYVVYTAPVENTDYFNNPQDPAAQSFRDLWGIYSTDGGQTWSTPENLTETAVNYQESVFPSVADIANGKVHVLWQRDDEPGHSLEPNPDPVTENDIVYYAFDYSDFLPDTSTGLINPALVHKVKFFPNPSDGLFTVDINELNVPVDIQVFDIRGRLVTSMNQVTGTTVIDLREQRQGMYLILLKTGNKILTNRIVINH